MRLENCFARTTLKTNVNKKDVERDRDKTLKPFAELLNTGKSLLWLLQYISEASFPDHTDNNK